MLQRLLMLVANVSKYASFRFRCGNFQKPQGSSSITIRTQKLERFTEFKYWDIMSADRSRDLHVFFSSLSSSPFKIQLLKKMYCTSILFVYFSKWWSWNLVYHEIYTKMFLKTSVLHHEYVIRVFGSNTWGAITTGFRKVRYRQLGLLWRWPSGDKGVRPANLRSNHLHLMMQFDFPYGLGSFLLKECLGNVTCYPIVVASLKWFNIQT